MSERARGGEGVVERGERRDSAGRGRLEIAPSNQSGLTWGSSSEPDRAGAAPATPLADFDARIATGARGAARRGGSGARRDAARGKKYRGKSRPGYQKVHDRIRASEIRAESTDPRSKATRAIGFFRF